MEESITVGSVAGVPVAKPKRNRPRKVVFTTDKQGRKVVLVGLSDGHCQARLMTEDWELLVAQDAHTGWCLNSTGNGHAYVRCGRERFHGSLETVARLIMEAGPGDVVRYRDGNRLNLCRDNLYFSRRGRAELQTPRPV
jgi:hypothetical protein